MSSAPHWRSWTPQRILRRHGNRAHAAADAAASLGCTRLARREPVWRPLHQAPWTPLAEIIAHIPCLRRLAHDASACVRQRLPSWNVETSESETSDCGNFRCRNVKNVETSESGTSDCGNFRCRNVKNVETSKCGNLRLRKLPKEETVWSRRHTACLAPDPD